MENNEIIEGVVSLLEKNITIIEKLSNEIFEIKKRVGRLEIDTSAHYCNTLKQGIINP